MQGQIYKAVLPNGLKVIVVPLHKTPHVSTQLWYHVGSKHEKSGQKGIAHLIEHMIFKGTERLSESDINEITHKLSGSCNAFTSHDYTGYLFDFPAHHWHEALPIMADCMKNCTFKEAFLNSELKAVVQELKMYRDDYISTVLERMMGAIFADHPYRYPIIGYKRDLWSLRREELWNFYQKHYIPNNATLVVVGDVSPDDVFRRAESAFGSIATDTAYAQEQFYHAKDLDAVRITLERDIQQPLGVVAWEVPGVAERQDYYIDLLSWIVGSGKGSRLNRLIVDELGLATDLESFTYDLFDQSLFVISFQPKEGVHIEHVVDSIRVEMNRIAQEGIKDQELQRAVKKTEMDFVALQENYQKYAYLVGKYTTALDESEYCLRYTEPAFDPELKNKVQKLATTHLRSAIMHEGYIVPVAPSERVYWLAHQELSDAEDNRILSGIVRESEVEEGMQVAHIAVQEAQPFVFPRAEQFTLSNGLHVRAYHDASLPTVTFMLELVAKHYFDPEDKQGLSLFLADVMQEGTKNFSTAEFAEQIEGNGMTLSVLPGLFSLRALNSDIQLACRLFVDMLLNPAFEISSIERVREQLIAEVKSFWDSPKKCAAQLMRQTVYGEHPYHKASLGTLSTLRSVSREDLIEAHAQWISPQGACLAIVGDFDPLTLPSILEETFATWTGMSVATPDFPPLSVRVPPTNIIHPMQRDQIVLAYGRASVARTDSHFDKLLLFDQIFTGGALGSMSSRLFELRERSGLFYTISGSLVAGAGKEPGMVYISTILSPDRLIEADASIRQVIDEGANLLTDEELDEARRAIETTIVDLFATHRQTAAAFLSLHEYGRPDDFFEQRIQALKSISRHEVQESVAQVLQSNTLNTVLVGRQQDA